MKFLIILAGVLLQGLAVAQTAQNEQAPLSYTYAELRFVDVDVAGGDGLRLRGSYELNNNWLLVGGFTSLDFNNDVDSTMLELGAGYVWHYNENFDFISTLQFVQVDVDTPSGSGDDNGFALSGGARGFIAPQFEVRGSVHHINLDDSDTFLELAGDYYFTDEISAGASLEFAGDVDTFTVGVRWLFM